MTIKLQVAGLSLDPTSKSPILVLCTENNSHILPVWIGSSEAIAISLVLQGAEVPRPLTHDLLLNMVEVLGFIVKSVQIPRVEDGVFYALIELANAKEVHLLDCRPSDAVALALRVGAPIFTKQQVIDEAGVEFPEDEDSSSVPVTAGDGGTAVLAEEHELEEPFQGIAQEAAELQDILKPKGHLKKELAELLEKMDPESKYKM